MRPIYINLPGDQSNWLSEEQLHAIAIDLIFEERLKQRLEFLYSKHSSSNGIVMFDIIQKHLRYYLDLVDLQNGQSRYGEADADGTNIHYPSQEEKRQMRSTPVAILFPQYMGRGITHLSWQNIENIRLVVDSFAKLQKAKEIAGIKDPISDMHQKLSAAIAHNLNNVPSNIAENLNKADALTTPYPVTFDLNQEADLKGIIIDKSRFLKIEQNLIAAGYLNQHRKWQKTQIALVALIVVLKVEKLFVPSLKNPKIRIFMSSRYDCEINPTYTKPVNLDPEVNKYARTRTNEFSHLIPKS